MKKLAVLAILLATASVSMAQSRIGTIADEAAKEISAKQNLPDLSGESHTLPPVVVTAEKINQFDRVGPYNQPVWTTTRMFPSTRTYVMTPPGTVMYEKWFDFRNKRNGPTQIRMRDELAFGLGNRLELDLYAHTVYDGPSEQKEFNWRGFSWEIRYALADWGKIPGNPTLYFEHKLINGRQGIEPKLLLGDRIGETDYIWSANLIYEANLAKSNADKEREYAGTFSLGKIINNDLMLGFSTMYRYHNYDQNIQELYAGPVVNWRISKQARLSFEHMPRISSDGYNDSRSLFIFGWTL